VAQLTGTVNIYHCWHATDNESVMMFL